jgi:hypothetical protein
MGCNAAWACSRILIFKAGDGGSKFFIPLASICKSTRRSTQKTNIDFFNGVITSDLSLP